MYLVGENTPGYLPETDPQEFDTLMEARRYARELVADLRNNYRENEERFSVSVDNSNAAREWFVVSTDRQHDLGRVIWISKEAKDGKN
jgi:hypothetical protein